MKFYWWWEREIFDKPACPMCTFVNANAPCPEGVSDSLTTYPHSVLTVGPSSIPLWPARTPLKTIIGGFPSGPVVKTSEHHGVLVWSLVRELRSHMRHDVAKKRKPKKPPEWWLGQKGIISAHQRCFLKVREEPSQKHADFTSLLKNKSSEISPKLI